MIHKKFSGNTCFTTFVLPLPYATFAKEVQLVGSFNKWDPTASPMGRVGQTFMTELPIPINGFYAFRYIVDGKWLNDLNADNYVPNPFGSDDAILSTYPVVEGNGQ